MSDDPRLPQAGYNPSPRRSLADELQQTASRNPGYQMPEPHEFAEPPPAPPSGQMPERSSPLAHLPTDMLSRMQRDMRSIIPSDPTFLAHVGVLLRALIQHEISDPARVEADKAQAQASAKQAAERADAALAARHEAEKAAVHPDDERQQHELAARHEQELRAVEQRKALADLQAKQAADAKEFAALQQKQRDALAAEFNPQIADPQGAPAQ